MKQWLIKQAAFLVLAASVASCIWIWLDGREPHRIPPVDQPREVSRQ